MQQDIRLMYTSVRTYRFCDFVWGLFEDANVIFKAGVQGKVHFFDIRRQIFVLDATQEDGPFVAVFFGLDFT